MPINRWRGSRDATTGDTVPWTREAVVDAIANLRTRQTTGRLGFERVDWRDLDLSDLDLRSLNLSGAGLLGSDMSGAFLMNTCFLRADLPEFLVGADLTGADLSKCVADGTDFTAAKLVNARLYRGDFYEVSFVRADLSRAFLTDALFHGCDFTGARLDGAEVSWSLNECTVDNATAVGARGNVLPDAVVIVDGERVPAIEWFETQTSLVRLDGDEQPDLSDLARWMDDLEALA